MQIHSIYHKEENTLIDENFHRLNSVKWFITFLFFVMIPINIIVYLIGSNETFVGLKDAISNIYLNERLRKNYLRIHNGIATFLLNNDG